MDKYAKEKEMSAHNTVLAAAAAEAQQRRISI
jgi:hypothetical protein